MVRAVLERVRGGKCVRGNRRCVARNKQVFKEKTVTGCIDPANGHRYRTGKYRFRLRYRFRLYSRQTIALVKVISPVM